MPKYKKILAVEAARHILHLVQVNLKRAGYKVVTACDGNEALEKADSEKPDLIVLGDTPAPLDSSEVLKRLRANEATKGVRVIMLTGKGDDLDFLRDGGSDR